MQQQQQVAVLVVLHSRGDTARLVLLQTQRQKGQLTQPGNVHTTRQLLCPARLAGCDVLKPRRSGLGYKQVHKKSARMPQMYVCVCMLYPADPCSQCRGGRGDSAKVQVVPTGVCPNSNITHTCRKHHPGRPQQAQASEGCQQTKKQRWRAPKHCEQPTRNASQAVAAAESHCAPRDLACTCMYVDTVQLSPPKTSTLNLNTTTTHRTRPHIG